MHDGVGIVRFQLQSFDKLLISLFKFAYVTQRLEKKAKGLVWIVCALIHACLHKHIVIFSWTKLFHKFSYYLPCHSSYEMILKQNVQLCTV